MENTSKRHHYVPKFYLKSFASKNSKRIFRYHKSQSGDLIEDLVYPKSTGYIYDANSLLHEKNRIELLADYPESQGYKIIDNSAALVHKKLLKSGKNSLSSEEIKDWSIFLKSLIERGPSRFYENIDFAKNSYEGIFEELLEKSKSHGRADAQEFVANIAKLFPKEAAIDLLKIRQLEYIKAAVFVKSIEKALWLTTGIQEGFSFITSDYPVNLQTEPKNNYILSLNIALSPNVLQSIYFIKDMSIEHHMKILPEILAIHNLSQITAGPNVIYSSDTLTDIGFVKHLKAMKLYLPKIKLSDTR